MLPETHLPPFPSAPCNHHCGRVVPPSRLASLLALLPLLVLGASLMAARPAHAALGEAEATVGDDAHQLRASYALQSRAAWTRSPFTVYELATPEGIRIREFVAATGTVFALTWQGPFRPDMRTLLGGHFQAYASAPRSADSTRTRLRIELPGLVVRATGHMHAFRGLAYLPDAMPAGVSAGDLQ